MLGFHVVFGAGIGFIIYLFALEGWGFVMTGKTDRPWNGLAALVLCCVAGGVIGLISYRVSHPGEASGGSMFYGDPATAMLFTKRLLAIGAALAGVYFIWQLAKGI